MMVSRKTRNINGDLAHLRAGEQYLLGLPLNSIQPQHLERAGLGARPTNGTCVLPPATRSAASRRNANGFDIIHRDQPKETRYRQISWTWTEHHGRDTVEKTGVKDVPYLRYPRTSIPPYAVELQIQTRPDGASFVVAGPFTVGSSLSFAGPCIQAARDLDEVFLALQHKATQYLLADQKRGVTENVIEVALDYLAVGIDQARLFLFRSRSGDIS